MTPISWLLIGWLVFNALLMAAAFLKPKHMAKIIPFDDQINEAS